MLDLVLVLSKSGVVLWQQQFGPVKGNPVDALVRTVLLEERTRKRNLALEASALGPDKSASAAIAGRALRQLVGFVAVFVFFSTFGLANRLYAVDFATFGYARQPCTDDGSTSAIRKAGRIDVLRDAPEVRWHWGPTAHRCDQALQPVRR